MRLFVLLRRRCEILGISPKQNVRSHTRNCLALVFVMQLSIATMIYLIFEAKTIQEYADSFYIFTTAFTDVINKFVIFLEYREGFSINREFRKNH